MTSMTPEIPFIALTSTFVSSFAWKRSLVAQCMTKLTFTSESIAE